MTDNDDPDPPRRISSSASRDEGEHNNEARVQVARVSRATRGSLAANHVAPTDPEVPAAKKRGVRRRRRSLVGLAALVVGLLSITVSLLYRAGRRVSALRPGGEGAPPTSILPRTDAVIFPHANAPSIMTGLRPPAPMPYRNELDDDDGHDDARPPVGSATAASAASQPKGPPPAIDIIRTPAF